MSSAKIELIRYEIKMDKDYPDLLGSYPLVVRATGFNVSSEVFVYHAVGKDDPYVNDMFEVVATPNQLEELPVNRATNLNNANEARPYYRRNQLELYCRNPEEAERIWDELKEEVRDLVKNINAMERLSFIEAVDVEESGIEVSTSCLDSTIIDLAYDPATVADLDENSNIVIPNASSLGWLPISEINIIERTEAIPANARLFYNITLDSTVSAEFASLATPYALHQLQIDDYPYPQNTSGIYTITADTIYWLDFDPDNFSDDVANLPKPPKNPWPEDYFVGAGSTSTRILKLVTFCSTGHA
jgi:hypothetical protein